MRSVPETLNALAIILGVEFLAVAADYCITPAGELPPCLPGYAPGSGRLLESQGLIALIIALGLFALACLSGAPDR